MMGLTTQGVVDESSDGAQIFELVCLDLLQKLFVMFVLICLNNIEI